MRIMFEIATLGVCDSCLLSKACPPQSSAYEEATTNPFSSFLLITLFRPPFLYDLSIAAKILTQQSRKDSVLNTVTPTEPLRLRLSV